MSLKEQMKTGKVYVEFGHSDPEDIAYEKVTEDQRQLAKDICFDYNNTRPTDVERKDELLTQLLEVTPHIYQGKSCLFKCNYHVFLPVLYIEFIFYCM